MAPQPTMMVPVKTFTKSGATWVTFVDTRGNGKDRNVGWLPRTDVMKVAGAIAKSKGEKTGGVKWSNQQLVDYVVRNTPWEAKGDDGSKPKPKGGDEKLPEPDEEGKIKTIVTAKCGHRFTARINAKRHADTKAWLESKDCPACRRGQKPKPEPKEEEPQQKDPQPQPEDEVEEEAQSQKFDPKDIDMDVLADILVKKVMERMQPVKMPKLHHEVLPEVIKLVNEDIPVWLEGPAGTSKSTLAAQVSEALGLPLQVISCNEAMSQTALFGYKDAHGTEHKTPLWEAFENGGVLLLDEMDNGNANILAALNSALSNPFATFAGRTINKHKDFRVLATANTAGLGPETGFIGRMGVDAATLDRFAKVAVPIDEKLETAIVKAIMPDGYAAWLKVVRKVRAGVESRGIRMAVTPRTSIHGAKMVKNGFSYEYALRAKAFKGMDETTIKSLLNEAGV